MRRLSVFGNFFTWILLAGLAYAGLQAYDALKVETASNCRVIDVVDQMRYSRHGEHGSSSMHYIVVTDKETFVVESSWLNGKFNNSDLFYRIKKDSVYSFRVAGIGKGFLTDYRNILEMYHKSEAILRPSDVAKRK